NETRCMPSGRRDVARIGILIVSLNGKPVAEIPLEDGTTLTFGRRLTDGVDYPLPHPNVGERHARIEIGRYGATLTHLDGTKVTDVDGERLATDQAVPLVPGARIMIGPFEIEYRPYWSPERRPGVAEEPAEAVEPQPPSDLHSLD